MSGARQRDAGETPLWGWCDFCGGRIHLGEEYYEDEDMRICTACARRYAWLHFLQRCVIRKARTHGPL